MKLKIIITTMALTAVCLGVHAQEKKTNPNPWFVQGQMGASYSTGDADFGKLLAPTGAIAVGKYFSPVWGARDRKSTRLNSSHRCTSRMPSSA